MLAFCYSWDSSVSANKVLLCLHYCGWEQNMSQEPHHGKLQAPAAPGRWELQSFGTSLVCTQICHKVTFYAKKQREFFFIIRTKITSAHKCESIFFQSSGVALSQILQPWQQSNKEALEDLYYQYHTNVSVHSCIFLCHLLYFWADSSICKWITVSRPVIMLECQAETSDGLIFSDMRSYSDVLTASVGSGFASPSSLPRLQSHYRLCA